MDIKTRYEVKYCLFCGNDDLYFDIEERAVCHECKHKFLVKKKLLGE